MKNNTKETLITICLLTVAILLLNPFNFWMPDMMVIGILTCALILFAVFANFILREKAIDERDHMHIAFAGRNAFLGGSAVLMLGIVIQGYSHSVDSWLVIALIIMVLVKIISRRWSDKNL